MAKAETITRDDPRFVEVMQSIREGDRIELVTIHGDRLRTTVRKLTDPITPFSVWPGNLRDQTYSAAGIASVRILKRAPKPDPLEGVDEVDGGGCLWRRVEPVDGRYWQHSLGCTPAFDSDEMIRFYGSVTEIIRGRVFGGES